MRQHIFRAKREEDGEWVYGSVFQHKDISAISNQNCEPEDMYAFTYEVDPDTVCEFTGFKDSNGFDIFEGDILSELVETDEGVVKSHQQVFFNEAKGSWHLDSSNKQDKTYSTELWIELEKFNYLISGNVFGNPELDLKLKSYD